MENYETLARNLRFEDLSEELLRDSICTTSDGTYALRETAQYAPRVLEYRDERLTEMFRDAEVENDLQDVAATERLHAELLTLPVGFPIPDVAYVNGDGKWCVDWEAKESDKALYACLSSESLLLVIVDTGDGKYLRLPCNLKTSDPLKHLRYGLTQVFEDE